MLRWNSIPAQRTKGWKLEWNVRAFYNSVFLIFFGSCTIGSWTCKNLMLQNRKTPLKHIKILFDLTLELQFVKYRCFLHQVLCHFHFFFLNTLNLHLFDHGIFTSLCIPEKQILWKGGPSAVSCPYPATENNPLKKSILDLVCNLNQPGCNCRLVCLFVLILNLSDYAW